MTKIPTNQSGEYKLGLILSKEKNQEMLEKGKKVISSIPPTDASSPISVPVDALSKAVSNIVDGMMLTIGSMEELSQKQDDTNRELGIITNQLNNTLTELNEIRNDNRILKRTIWVVLTCTLFITVTGIFSIKRNLKSTEKQIDAIINTSLP